MTSGYKSILLLMLIWEIFLLAWWFVFYITNLFLMWTICFWCEQFVFDVVAKCLVVRKFHNFSRKVLSNFLRMTDACLEMSSNSENQFVFSSGQIMRVSASHNTARLWTLGNSTFLIRLPGAVSDRFNARQLEIFSKMPLKTS